MNKVEKAIQLLADCADALDDLPEIFRSRTLIGYNVHSAQLRSEAMWLTDVLGGIKEIRDAD